MTLTTQRGWVLASATIPGACSVVVMALATKVARARPAIFLGEPVVRIEVGGGWA